MPSNAITPPAADATQIASPSRGGTIAPADAIFEAVFDRSLNFRIELPYDTALSFIRRIDQYNEFHWSTVTETLERIDGLTPRSRYDEGNPNNGKRDYTISVGREGSPVIYLERLEFFGKERLDDATIRAICREMELSAKADESHFRIVPFTFSKGRNIEIRFWWADDNGAVAFRCRPTPLLPFRSSIMVRTFIITGDTWSSREDLKSLGGRWVPHLNAWLAPETEQEAVAQLRQIIGFDVHLVTLPIEIPYTAQKRLARTRAAAPSRIPSPTAS